MNFAPGLHTVVSGDFDLGSLGAVQVAAPGMVIEAAPGATLSGWNDQRPTGITLKGFTVPCPATGAATLGLSGDRMVLEACAFTEPGGTPALVAMGGLTVRNCTFHKVNSGISVQGHGVSLIGNSFEGLIRDAIAIGKGIRNTLVEANTFLSFYGPWEHLDCIEVGGGCQNVTLRDNVFIRQSPITDEAPPQFIFCDSGADNVLIEWNAALGCSEHGIRFYGATNITVRHNYLQGCTDFEAVPVIDLGKGVGQVIEANERPAAVAPGDRSGIDAWLAARGKTPPSPLPAPAPGPTGPDPRIAKVRDLALKARKARAKNQWIDQIIVALS